MGGSEPSHRGGNFLPSLPRHGVKMLRCCAAAASQSSSDGVTASRGPRSSAASVQLPVRRQSQPVADPEDRASGEGSLGAVLPAGVQGAQLPLRGVSPPPLRSWSIRALCVMVSECFVNTKV